MQSPVSSLYGGEVSGPPIFSKVSLCTRGAYVILNYGCSNRLCSFSKFLQPRSNCLFQNTKILPQHNSILYLFIYYDDYDYDYYYWSICYHRNQRKLKPKWPALSYTLWCILLPFTVSFLYSFQSFILPSSWALLSFGFEAIKEFECSNGK